MGDSPDSSRQSLTSSTHSPWSDPISMSEYRIAGSSMTPLPTVNRCQVAAVARSASSASANHSTYSFSNDSCTGDIELAITAIDNRYVGARSWLRYEDG